MVSAREKTIFVLLVGVFCVFIFQQRVYFVGFPCLIETLKVYHGDYMAGCDRRGPVRVNILKVSSLFCLSNSSGRGGVIVG